MQLYREIVKITSHIDIFKKVSEETKTNAVLRNKFDGLALNRFAVCVIAIPLRLANFGERPLILINIAHNKDGESNRPKIEARRLKGMDFNSTEITMIEEPSTQDK